MSYFDPDTESDRMSDPYELVEEIAHAVTTGLPQLGSVPCFDLLAEREECKWIAWLQESSDGTALETHCIIRLTCVSVLHTRASERNANNWLLATSLYPHPCRLHRAGTPLVDDEDIVSPLLAAASSDAVLVDGMIGNPDPLSQEKAPYREHRAALLNAVNETSLRHCLGSNQWWPFRLLCRVPEKGTGTGKSSSPSPPQTLHKATHWLHSRLVDKQRRIYAVYWYHAGSGVKLEWAHGTLLTDYIMANVPLPRELQRETLASTAEMLNRESGTPAPNPNAGRSHEDGLISLVSRRDLLLRYHRQSLEDILVAIVHYMTQADITCTASLTEALRYALSLKKSVN